MTKFCVLYFFIFLIAFQYADCQVADEKVEIYELKKGNFSAKFTNWGASLISLIVPDRNGNLADVVLGYNSISDYYPNGSRPFGSIVGRVANRIRGAQFTLDGTVYKLIANDGNNTIHGGPRGFSRVVWQVIGHQKEGLVPFINFFYRSFDGEGGFPGDLQVSVSYFLIRDNMMAVKMNAVALNKPTPVSLANHAFWNLGGHNSGDILSHEIQIFGSHITALDSQRIPTGDIVPVNGTPYDFLKSRTVGSRINELPRIYDINYVLDGGNDVFKQAVVLQHKESGRVLKLSTDAPGMQFYTGFGLKDVKGKDGYVYKPQAGLCLETQGFPDAVNHPNFPSQIVSIEKPYKHSMLFEFSTN